MATNGYNGGRGNGNGNGRPSNKKKMHPAVKFALIVLGIVFAFIVVAGAGVMAYISNRTYEEAKRPPSIYEVENKGGAGIVGTVKRIIDKVPERTNFIIMGVDDEGGGIRSDTLMMGSFNSKTKKIYLVSVPRDIMISLPKEDVAEYNALGIYPPSYMKMNEILAYVGKDYGVGAVMKQLEREFGVKLDYFVKVDTDGFVEIVDALGGVEMTLTRNYNYYDPDQNLRINLNAGTQRLMGEDAEGLVRFRADYARGDLQRIEVQQQFMGELFRQTLQKENLVQHAPELLQTFMNNVTTNMSVPQASKYLQFLPALTSENLEMFSLGGGNSESYRGPDELSYLRLDRTYTDEIIDEVFHGIEETPPADSKELKIAVLNGSGVSGLAKKTSDTLEGKGYTISEIGDYGGKKEEKDRIFVKKSGYGTDLKELFDNCERITDKSNVSGGSDITIILGTHNKETSD